MDGETIDTMIVEIMAGVPKDKSRCAGELEFDKTWDDLVTDIEGTDGMIEIPAEIE